MANQVPRHLLRRFIGAARGGSFGAESGDGPVTFPATSLAFRVRLGVGAGGTVPADLSADPGTWNWIDITDRVRFYPGIDISTGRRGFGELVDSGEMTLNLTNTDGAFTRRNPNSPYYGLLTPNTPIWVEVNAGSGWKTRAQMFVTEWPTRWPDLSGNDCIAEIRCAGVMSRLAQQNEVTKSALRRTIEASAPFAYWALDEGTLALSGQLTAGSGGNLTSLAWGDSVESGSEELASWLGPGVSLTLDTAIAATTPLPASPSRVTLDGVYVFNTVDTANTQAAGFTLAAESTFAFGSRWPVQVNFNNVSNGFIQAGTPGIDVTTVNTDVILAGPHHLRLDLIVSGSNVAYHAYVDGVEIVSGTAVGASIAGHQWVRMFNDGADGSTSLWTDFAVWVNVTPPSVTAMASAAQGYVGEQAHARIERLCAETHVAYYSQAGSSHTMGPLAISTAQDGLLDAEAVDGGVLYETGWGLGYLSVAERNNAAASMILDFNQGHLAATPKPDDDYRWLTNRWTVSRVDGGEFTAECKTGPMGVQFGAIEDAAIVNVQTDAQLPGQAGWRVHLGTIDEDRWSAVPLNFARNPDLIDTYTALPFGARVVLTNPPPEMPPDDVDVVVDGLVEHLDPRMWIAALATTPASAHRVYRVGPSPGNLGRLNSKLSYLPAAIGTGDTSFLVATPGVIWDTSATNFDINIGGEKISVTSITGSSSPQTFTVTRSVNGISKAHPTAAKVSLWQPPVYALVD